MSKPLCLFAFQIFQSFFTQVREQFSILMQIYSAMEKAETLLLPDLGAMEMPAARKLLSYPKEKPTLK